MWLSEDKGRDQELRAERALKARERSRRTSSRLGGCSTRIWTQLVPLILLLDARMAAGAGGPTPNPIFLLGRQTPLNCKTDGPATLCTTKDSCDTQKMPRDSFKKLDWVSLTRESIQKIGNNKC